MDFARDSSGIFFTQGSKEGLENGLFLYFLQIQRDQPLVLQVFFTLELRLDLWIWHSIGKELQ